MLRPNCPIRWAHFEFARVEFFPQRSQRTVRHEVGQLAQERATERALRIAGEDEREEAIFRRPDIDVLPVEIVLARLIPPQRRRLSADRWVIPTSFEFLTSGSCERE